MEIRRLGAADVELYRALRLRSVREHPEAFLASFEEESARTVEEDRQRLAEKEGREATTVPGTSRSFSRCPPAIWCPDLGRRGAGRAQLGWIQLGDLGAELTIGRSDLYPSDAATLNVRAQTA